MADEDELLREALAVIGTDVARTVTANIMAGRTLVTPFPAQWITTGGARQHNPAFAAAYLPEVIAALQVKLLGLVADRDGTVQPNVRFQVLSLTQLTLDPELQSFLLTVVGDESPTWPPGTEAARDASLTADVVTQFVKQRPSRFNVIVNTVRERRDKRISEERVPGEAPRPAPPTVPPGPQTFLDPPDLLRPVPPQGDILAQELAGPARAFGIRMLRGVLGESDVAGHRRLFRTFEFNEYLDIPRDAIIKTLDLRTVLNPVGGSLVWVAVGVKLIHGSVGYTRPEIEGKFIAGSGGGVLGRGEEWTSIGRGEEWTSLGRGEEWTSLGRGEEWTSLGR